MAAPADALARAFRIEQFRDYLGIEAGGSRHTVENYLRDVRRFAEWAGARGRHDPQALTATRENAAKNGLAQRIRIAGPADDAGTGFDIAVANILSGPLISLAPGLAPRVLGGGALLLAGLLAAQAGEVAEAYRPWFDIGPAAEREGWTLLAGRRRVE